LTRATFLSDINAILEAFNATPTQKPQPIG
jgi:hypothetical protein